MSNITQLLEQAGEPDANSQLFELVYSELRQLAAACMRTERPDHTLQPTALVNEAYLRLVGGEGVSWQGRAHFFGAAGRVMRRILVDHARARNSAKRGGIREKLELLDNMATSEHGPETLLAVDAALEGLGRIDPRCVRVVELLFFAGMSQEEAAEVMGVSVKTLKRDWQFARVWMERQLRPGKDPA